MPCPDRLSQWSEEVSSAFGHLSKPQVWGLVLWSAGIAFSGAAGIVQLSALLALVLKQLEPEQAEVSWYGMRTWIETGFKDFKRGLWGWHHSKMQDASRVERLWLAMAVAQVWTVSIGCQAEEEQRQETLGESLPARHIARRRRKRSADQPPTRRLSCVVCGRLCLSHGLIYGPGWTCRRVQHLNRESALAFSGIHQRLTATHQALQEVALRRELRESKLRGLLRLVQVTLDRGNQQANCRAEIIQDKAIAPSQVAQIRGHIRLATQRERGQLQARYPTLGALFQQAQIVIR